MSYTTNPKMPRIRRDAAQLVYKGWSTRKVARHFGFSQSVIVKWVKKAKTIGYHAIPTRSSRPEHHPKQISSKIVKKIIEFRLKTKRTTKAITKQRLNQEIGVSLISYR